MEIQKVLHLHKELEKKKPKIDGLYLVSEKLDGIYVYADYIDGEWANIHTSAQRELPSLRWVKEEILPKLNKPNGNCRIIAEATIDGLDFYTANGRFNKTVGGYEEREAVLNIHDVIHYIGCKPAKYRIDYVNQICDTDLACIRRIPVLGVSDDYRLWMKHAEDVWERDGEGVILKRADSYYTPGKRNSDLMKIKLEETYDLLVVEHYMTIGEKGNKNINLKLKDKRGCFVDVRIGKDRDVAAFEAESPIGKVATIKCMKQTDDGYREPRFLHIRFDKLPHEID